MKVFGLVDDLSRYGTLTDELCSVECNEDINSLEARSKFHLQCLEELMDI